MIRKYGVIRITEGEVRAEGFEIVAGGPYPDASVEVLSWARQKIDKELEGMKNMYTDFHQEYGRWPWEIEVTNQLK